MTRPQGLWHDLPRRNRQLRVHRPTAWVRVSVGIADHPDIVGLPSDAARWTFLVILTLAKVQPESGAFRSERHLRGLLDRYQRRKLPYLYGAGLLERRADGAVVVHNWRLWQTDRKADMTHPERQRRYRERQKRRAQTGHNWATTGPNAVSMTVHNWAGTERERAESDGAVRTSRVTPRDGGPPIGGDSAVTPLALDGGGAGVGQRREMARAIREAATPDLRHRFKSRFDKEWGHLYGRRSVA